MAESYDYLLAALQDPTNDEAAGDRWSDHWLGDALDAGRMFADAGGAEFVLAWVGLSVFVGIAARWMKHSAGAWFVISLIVSPLIGGMFLLSRGKGRRTCPYCQDLNDVEVVYCYTCGQEMPLVDPGSEPE